MLFVNLERKIGADLVTECSPSVKGVFDLLKAVKTYQVGAHRPHVQS